MGIAEKKMAILKMICFSTLTPSRPVEQDFPGAFWRAHQEMAGHVAMESPTVSQRCVNAVMRRVVGRPVVGLACGLRSMKKKATRHRLHGMCPSYTGMINHYDFTACQVVAPGNS